MLLARDFQTLLTVSNYMFKVTESFIVILLSLQSVGETHISLSNTFVTGFNYMFMVTESFLSVMLPILE